MKFILCLLAFVAFEVQAQNTLSLTDDIVSPKGEITSITWMEGHWKGEAFGGITEEIWSPPQAGTMLFSFRLMVDDEVAFYELGHIKEVNESLVFELKHFDSNLKGWEEKDEVQSFKLIKITEKRVYFEGFTFEKISADEINIYALIHQEDGLAKEVKFHYKKERP